MNIDELLDKAMPITESGCFVWTMYANKKGYGRIAYKRRMWLTHRLSWHLAYGYLPSDKMVCHKCDNPSCINPNHLFLGDAKINTKDMDDKGRRKPMRGESHGMAKLTESDVIDIRQCIKDGISLETISQAWGVTKSMIGMIKNGHNWRHLGGRIFTFHEYDDDELYSLYKACREEINKRGIGEA